MRDEYVFSIVVLDDKYNFKSRTTTHFASSSDLSAYLETLPALLTDSTNKLYLQLEMCEELTNQDPLPDLLNQIPYFRK